MSSAPPQSVVIVDDEQSFTELLGLLLAENLDCPIHTFTRPRTALENLAALNPAVIVTDYYMPEINGIELMKAAAAIVPQTNFILITGHLLDFDEDELKRVLNLKCALNKPFGWRKLGDEIVRHWPNEHVPAYRA